MPIPTAPVDILFVSEHPLWPLDQGFRIRGYQMSRAMVSKGLQVACASLHDDTECVRPASLQARTVKWPHANEEQVLRFTRGWSGKLSGLRRRVAEHQALDKSRLAGVVALVDKYRPRVVVGLGQHSPIMLAGLRGVPAVKKVWYAADDVVWFQLSCLRREGLRAAPQRIRKAVLYAALERLFVPGLDGVVGVTESDAAMLGVIGGAADTVSIPNGVDVDFFKPQRHQESNALANSVVFWGRMDFEPNIDAVRWFADHVWPKLIAQSNDAVFMIAGKNPTASVNALSERPGIRVMGEVDDVRSVAHQAAVTVLPVRCGGGIKNKLLEAAAMARPIVASHRAVGELSCGGGNETPVLVAGSPGQWAESISKLWGDAAMCAAYGSRARTWVMANHDWSAAATKFISWIDGLAPHRLPDTTRCSITRTEQSKLKPQPYSIDLSEGVLSGPDATGTAQGLGHTDGITRDNRRSAA